MISQAMLLADASLSCQTEAEKAAWAIAKEAGLHLVTINPTFVLGPVIGRRADATSILDFKVT